jgi:dihydrofolate reductase
MSKLIAIAAMSRNRVIGNQGKIPWHLPEDLEHFKKVTMGHTVLMGRKTYESIGRALPGRINVVLTREGPIPDAHVLSCRDVEKYLHRATAEVVFVIGGGMLYQQMLPRCHELYLTTVNQEVEGDTFFPDFDFRLQGTILERPEFMIQHFINPSYETRTHP